MQRIQAYVVGKLREHQAAIEAQVNHNLNTANQRILELEQTINQQAAEISQLRTAVETTHRWDARLGRVEAQVTDLELWKKGAIAQINTLINLQYEQLEAVTNQWKASSVETQTLAKQMAYIKQLSKPRRSWVDGADLGPLLDTHAEELPPSGAGLPNRNP